MLLNTFFKYQVETKEEGHITASLELVKDHDIYKGHFPQVPITPGVCQVQMLKELLENEFGKNIMLTYARDIKFINMINPNDVSELKFDIKHKPLEGNKHQVSAVMSKNEVIYLKIRADFSEE